MRRFVAVTGLTAAALVLSGCAAPAAEEPTPLPPAPDASEVAVADGPAQPVGEPVELARGLAAPWSIAFVGDSALISERDSALIKERTADGTLRDAGSVPDVAPGGEAGLLGIAPLVDGDATWLYAYLTTASDNRIVRMPLTGAAGGLGLGAPEPVLTGLAKASNHDGGRIGFGPDGMLYATVGDANVIERAQDPASLNGKILRMTPEGAVPDDNPTAGSLVYSLGHRNPQGIAWDESGQLWAAEFGQDTWDELNTIAPGRNYGWPTAEGVAGASGLVDPVVQWATDDASPSGLAYSGGTLFLAALGGEKVFAIVPTEDGPQVTPYFQGQFGRIRDVVAAPDGTLWLLTNNTDGRGAPREGDDRIIQVQLAPTEAG